jgi:hypothetical protein
LPSSPPPPSNVCTGIFMLFFMRALLHGQDFPTQSVQRYCRLRLAVDLATQ